MKVSCLQENLSKGLSIVSRAVASRSTLPVLGNILLATEQGRLKLAATNLELAVTDWIGAKVDDEGSVTLPARVLIDFVNFAHCAFFTPCRTGYSSLVPIASGAYVATRYFPAGAAPVINDGKISTSFQAPDIGTVLQIEVKVRVRNPSAVLAKQQ